MRNNKKGFTLIELLVVIAIIGFLATVAMYSLNNARIKARDTKRLADLQQIKKALELYYDDNNSYPPIYANTNSNADGCGPGDRWCDLENYLASYIDRLPRDPKGLQNDYQFYYDSDSGDNYQTYGLGTMLESPANSSLMENDKGHYDQMYEIGVQPQYCEDNYSERWVGSENTVCQTQN